MIDIASERLIRLEDVRDYLPSSRKGKYLSKSVVFRWASKGVRGVVLETLRIAGGRMTSVEAIHRFVVAQNGDPVPRPAAPLTNLRRSERAARDLAKHDI